jgi:hypothetical protein
MPMDDLDTALLLTYRLHAEILSALNRLTEALSLNQRTLQDLLGRTPKHEDHPRWSPPYSDQFVPAPLPGSDRAGPVNDA